MIPTARLRSLFPGIASNQRLMYFLFSSSTPKPALAAVRPRNGPANIFEDDSEGGGSSVYRHALKFSRPYTIKIWELRSHLLNSITLIGSVEQPPTAYSWQDRLGVYTLLNVKTSPDSGSSVRILVEMWDEIAKVALEHLKPGDHIYVSGRLASYKKPDSYGNDRLVYKVIVKELNYVKQHNEKLRSQEVEQSKSQGKSSSRKKEDRLHLWQVFFFDPHQWYDSRRNKRNPRSPDFKHKSTGEALWINADDPPWIKRQLELHDSRAATGSFLDRNSHPDLSSYVNDDPA